METAYKWPQSGARPIPNRSQTDPKPTPNRPQTDPKPTPDQFQTDSKLIPEWLQTDPQLTPDRPRTDLQHVRLYNVVYVDNLHYTMLVLHKSHTDKDYVDWTNIMQPDIHIT